MKYTTVSLNAYLNELASKKPVPGGGSAAAFVASLAVSLSLMVARIMVPKIYPKEKKKWNGYIQGLQLLKKNMMKCINNDPRLYQKVIDAYACSKKNKKRDVKIEKSLVDSYESMRNLVIDICAVKQLNLEIGKKAIGAIANDLKVSNNFLEAAFSSAYATAKINIEYMKDNKLRKNMIKQLRTLKK